MGYNYATNLPPKPHTHMATLNATFESKPDLEDEGYDSGSKNFNIPTPLRRTSKIHHISSVKKASFDLHTAMPHNMGTRGSDCRPVHICLTFSSSEEDDDDSSMDEIPSPNSTLPVHYHSTAFLQLPSKCTLNMYVTLEAEEEEMEENFQAVPLNG